MKYLVLGLFFLSLNSFGHGNLDDIHFENLTINKSDKKYFIVVDRDAVYTTKRNFRELVRPLQSNSKLAVLEVDENTLDYISIQMHQDFKRCGGFSRFDTLEEALSELYAQDRRFFAKQMRFEDYSITEDELVNSLIKNVDAKGIEFVIRKLSQFRNRYFKGPNGVASQTWLKSHWENIVKSRNDAEVEFFDHSNWDQPSLILTIKGSVEPERVIVVGGHADSIAGFWNRTKARAPGADDNASGMGTISEIIKVLMDSNYKPNKTLMFMGYAAEEVGLLGSKAIATHFRKNNVDVAGVLQLDMTNFNGSNEDIVLMKDYTNDQQNMFLGKLIDRYLPNMKWGFDKCGYACSDHASWHSQEYPASMPFESKKGQMNRNIHTARDLIDASGGNASHASKFAKLGVAFIVELDR